jgi:hypothetical protein
MREDAATPRTTTQLRPRLLPPLRSLVPGEGVIAGLVSLAAWYFARDWIAGLAVLVLWAAWRYLPHEDGPPVIAMAFTFQWLQVTIGVFYHGFTGRSLDAVALSDYRPMVLIGLGCLVALLLGLKLGMRFVERPPPAGSQREEQAFSWPALVIAYVASVAVTGTLQEFAWEVHSLTQAILALTYVRFAMLFMMFCRLCKPRIRWGWIGVILAAEVVLGLTGYFAGFREPLMLAAVALLGAFDRRKVTHWLAVGLFGAIMFLTGLMWMAVRTDYRQDFENQTFAASREARLERIVGLTSQWLRQDFKHVYDDLDIFVDRMWVIYYPALAVSRVPSMVPHENGAIMWRALLHIVTPRLLFPDKAVLESDSEMVMRYSGVWAAGADQDTSIAFGYAAESYVDFGVPLMFLPVFVFGVLMGMAYHWWLRIIRHRELAVGLVAVMFWMSLYLFERSWIKTLGLTVTMMVYLGGLTILVDRVLLWTRVLGRGTRRLAGARRGRG